MSTITLRLPDDLLSRIQSRAVEAGFDSPEAYAESLLRLDVGDKMDDRALAQLLLDRLNDGAPSVELTDEFWGDLDSRIDSIARGA